MKTGARLACTVLLLASAATGTQAQSSSVGYPSVAAALDALRASKDARISVENGWTIVTEPSGLTIWSFTPQGHPAHPAVVKRQLVEQDGAWHVLMSALCQAQKAACDQLIADFNVLNERMRAYIERDRQQKGNKQ